MNWMRRGLLLAICGVAVSVAGCTGGQSGDVTAPPVVTGNTPGEIPQITPPPEAVATDPKAEGADQAKDDAKKPDGKATDAKKGGPVNVTIETSKGNIDLELYPNKAPATVANFLSYVKKGHFNGTIFHRVIPGFMIQGGGMKPDMNEKATDPPIQLEAQSGLSNVRGTIAMARTGDPNSATSQFFINVADNSMKLDFPNPDGNGYAVFGKVTKGMDVADKIVAVETGDKEGHENVPLQPITIKSVKVK